MNSEQVERLDEMLERWEAHYERHKKIVFEPYAITGMESKLANHLQFARDALEASQQAVGWCQWGPTEDGGYNYFETSCGRSYFVVEGTLAENEYQHCPGCGGAIEEGTQDE